MCTPDNDTKQTAEKPIINYLEQIRIQNVILIRHFNFSSFRVSFAARYTNFVLFAFVFLCVFS